MNRINTHGVHESIGKVYNKRTDQHENKLDHDGHTNFAKVHQKVAAEREKEHDKINSKQQGQKVKVVTILLRQRTEIRLHEFVGTHFCFNFFILFFFVF
jgi:hypothetical protein